MNLRLTRKQRFSKGHFRVPQIHPRNDLQQRVLVKSLEIVTQKVLEGSWIGILRLTLNVGGLHYWKGIKKIRNTISKLNITLTFCVLEKISKLHINKPALLIRKLRNSVVK